ncbi:MAG: alcohol dehydrogenase family protein [Gammaproteobacteria bacterium]|nr:alcohol dehydrogenase family protein [Gammaproteobacteria bacterium]
MFAVLLTGHGGYERLEWREDLSVPEPRDGEVLIRVAAAGVNNTDINTRTAWYSRAVTEGTTSSAAANGIDHAQAADSGWTGTPLAFPRIQGADACGYIVAVGNGVDRARIGERVLVEPVFRPPSSTNPRESIYFGSECDGAFAEFARVPSRHAHRIESTLEDAELASFPCAYSAAENMLTRAGVRRGETVLVTGASGGVGSAAVQLARSRGAQVVAVADPAKAADLTGLGAARTLGRDVNVAEALGSESVDVVIDVVGGQAFASLLDVLVRGGRYATAGAIAGPVVQLDLRTLYLKDLRLLGCTVLDHEVFANLIRAIERGEVRPIVAARYPLERIVDAQRAFLEKRHVGKIVLIPPSRV